MDWPLGQQTLVSGVDHQASTTRRRPPDRCEEHVRPSQPPGKAPSFRHDHVQTRCVLYEGVRSTVLQAGTVLPMRAAMI